MYTDAETQDSGLVSGVSELLPTNTRIFSSTVRLGRVWYTIAVTGGAAVVVLVVCTAGFKDDGNTLTSLFAAAAAVAALVSVALFLLRYFAARRYTEALRVGEWHEGIIVFPSGDIVVRFSGCLRGVDRTIEASYLSRADVERRCSPWRLVCCWRRNFLKLYFLGIDARPAVVSVCEDDLRESTQTIAEYINQLKAQCSGTTGVGGLGVLGSGNFSL